MSETSELQFNSLISKSTSEKKKKRKKKKKDEGKHKDRNESISEVAQEAAAQEESQDNNSESKKKKHKKNKKKRNRSTESDETQGKVEPPAKKSKPMNNSTPATKSDSNSSNQTSNLQIDEKDLYPYEVVPDDHCETPVEAYRDISQLFELYAQSIGKTKSSLAIYDPYFCEGNVILRMKEIGFDNVYNRKEDFYQQIAANKCPSFDVLMTNPPYSQDHMEKLLNYVLHHPSCANKPFALLIPNYVYCKDYFQRELQNPRIAQMFCFITPKNGSRYLYTTPKGRRQQKSGKITSPFPTFWYCGRFPNTVLAKLDTRNIHLARRITDISLEIAPDNDPRKKKLRNNMKRKKNKQRKKADSST